MPVEKAVIVDGWRIGQTNVHAKPHKLVLESREC